MALEAVLAKRCEEKGAFGRCRGERYCRRILRLSVTGGDELQTGAEYPFWLCNVLKLLSQCSELNALLNMKIARGE